MIFDPQYEYVKPIGNDIPISYLDIRVENIEKVANIYASDVLTLYNNVLFSYLLLIFFCIEILVCQ